MRTISPNGAIMAKLIASLTGEPEGEVLERLRFIEEYDYTAALVRYARKRTERGLTVNPMILCDALLALQQHYALVALGVERPVPSVGTDEILEAHMLADTSVFFGEFCPGAFGGALHHIEGPDPTGEMIANTEAARERIFTTVPGGDFGVFAKHGDDMICWPKLERAA
jgi:hypothetical protein